MLALRRAFGRFRRTIARSPVAGLVRHEFVRRQLSVTVFIQCLDRLDRLAHLGGINHAVVIGVEGADQRRHGSLRLRLPVSQRSARVSARLTGRLAEALRTVAVLALTARPRRTIAHLRTARLTRRLAEALRTVAALALTARPRRTIAHLRTARLTGRLAEALRTVTVLALAARPRRTIAHL